MLKRSSKLKVITWALTCAWKINKRILIFWLSLAVSMALLPSIILLLNQQVIRLLTEFIGTGAQIQSSIVSTIITMGIVITISGLSSRLNGDLIYMKMYDYYYIGMQEILINHINKIEMNDLLKKEIYDEYDASFVRAGSLTNFMSSLIMLVNKIVNIGMLLAVSFTINKFYFVVSLLYSIGVYLFNLNYIEKLRWDTTKYQLIQRLSKYYAEMPLSPNISKEIRVYDIEEFVTSKWKNAYKSVMDFDRNRSFQMNLRNMISDIFYIVLIIIVLIIGILDIANGKMHTDAFLISFTLCINLKKAMSGIASTFMETDYGLFALEKQYHFIKYTPITSDNSDGLIQVKDDNDVIFEAKDLSFAYPNGYQAIDKISFKIKRGNVVALVGLNGSGKTTLTKLLIDQYKPTNGTLLFKGHPYAEYKKGYISDQLAVFFQDIYLFHTSLLDNVSYGERNEFKNVDKVITALAKADADNIVNKLPNGLNTVMGREVDPKGVDVSGGEKQKIAMARSYMGDREYMIFDEPASKLDPIAELKQFRNIREKISGKTTILISHRMAFARLADQIIVMEHGRIIEQGSHEELIHNRGLYYQMYHEQAKWYETDEAGLSCNKEVR